MSREPQLSPQIQLAINVFATLDTNTAKKVAGPYANLIFALSDLNLDSLNIDKEEKLKLFWDWRNLAVGFFAFGRKLEEKLNELSTKN